MTDQVEAPAKKAKPTASELARQPICTECGGPLPARQPGQKGPARSYCTDACKKARAARRLVRGSAVIEWAQSWRRNRAQGEIAQASFAQLCQILDQFNAEDFAAGRPSADLAAARMIVEQTRYFDRQRKSPERERRAAEPKPDPLADILRQIAEGHNDPRALAAAALEARG